mmetsp:Transcript_28670/g.66105  ORF Transcript_28670/g.66105 Transcript_28670/m.66105 type:complete len:287 (+) Transcript_28670:59-919(+)
MGSDTQGLQKVEPLEAIADADAKRAPERGSSSGTEEESEEPPVREHVALMAVGAGVAGAIYGTLRTVLSRDSAEDIVDFLHALSTTSISGYGLLCMEPHPTFGRALPSKLASSRGPVVKMYAASLGYFMGDMCKILIDVTVRRSFPNLWLGRLAHHSIQLGASLPGIFGAGASEEITLVWRSILCMAYVAEFSSIFLRLSNLFRRAGAPSALRRTCSWSVLASFFASRIVNFALAIRLYVAARPVFPDALFRLGAVVQVGGYTLSLGWFLKLLRIAVRTNGFAKLK